MLPLLVAVGCGTNDGPVEKSFTLKWAGPRQPEQAIPVKLTVPDSWKVVVDATGSPTFAVPGVTSMLPTLGVLAIPCPFEGDCLEKTLELQFGKEALPALPRETLGEGRVFVVEDTRLAASGGRRRVHARLVALHPASRSAVMCVVFLMDAAGDKLPELRKVCESLTL